MIKARSTVKMKDLLNELVLFVGQSAFVLTAALGILLLTHFPYNTDRPLSVEETAKARAFYGMAYDSKKSVAVSPQEEKYATVALNAAKGFRVKERVTDFAREYNLANKKALDIGSGQGYLQDVVEDYTGLDISPAVARYYHKRFVLGSATALPFEDSSFDAAWSIWVFEHVPNPEAALSEARRVVKDGGVIFLEPAWDCVSWAANGYDVRPYSDFGIGGRLIKAAIPARRVLSLLATPLVRFSRAAARSATREPSRFHYTRLTPNFQTYWEPDSDAVNSLDFSEMAVWFQSRGDECLSCQSGWRGLIQANTLVVKLHKSARR